MQKKSLYIRIAGTIATLGPIGTKLPAPGTWGAAAGTLFYFSAFLLTGAAGNPFWFSIAAGTLVLISVPLCDAGEKLLGKTDPGEVNFDEFAVMPLCFAGLGNVIAEADALAQTFWLFGGFALFRFFDILKPLGIKKLQKLPGGLGVTIDDLAAALLVCGCLWAFRGIQLYLSTNQP